MKLPIPVVIIFFLSERGKFRCIPFAIMMEKMKSAINKPIDAHLLSSPSIGSRRNVAIAPPNAARPTRSQNKMSIFFFLIIFSNSRFAGSVGGKSLFSEFSVSGFFAGFDFLCLANEISRLTRNIPFKIFGKMIVLRSKSIISGFRVNCYDAGRY